ncbi:MAG: WYL domain-containing transcriptional regulator [Nitrospinae bacterium]|nr:WYL domain-containing transcriptional regulator [Nitrospinota bacterium]
MPRNSQSVRIIGLMNDLRSASGVYPSHAASKYMVTVRTIYRDMEGLEKLGCPIYKDESGFRVVWRMQKTNGAESGEIPFSQGEKLSLLFASNLAKKLGGSSFENNILSLVGKLVARGNGTNGFQSAKNLFFPFVKGAKGYASHERALDKIVSAIIESRVVSIVYNSFHSGRVKKLSIHPYHVFEHSNGLYVYCHSPAHGKIITLAVERIKNVTVTNELFQPGPARNIPEISQDSIGLGSGRRVNVELEFDENAAKYVKERRWHPSQKIVEMEDGRVRLSMQVCLDYELTRFILGFGPAVRVVKPAGLRNRIAASLKETLENY